MRSKEGDDTESLSLPVDLIIEILTKLPPRSLSRLICVSKLWLSIIHGERACLPLDLMNQSPKDPL
ncbi:hypothetical protein F2Q70_00001731 [Brassica cretica]|uniref:F-box domain-containing protein n=1 Tax=Brassica cretica TaxID=69181 RepID=A0A8S9IMG3_BRACR|nr:hypothetical protein F2Q70_00001731 [Brassica cretica]